MLLLLFRGGAQVLAKLQRILYSIIKYILCIYTNLTRVDWGARVGPGCHGVYNDDGKKAFAVDIIVTVF